MTKQYLNIEIDNLDNSAFEGEDLGPELGRILRGLAQRLETMSRAQLANDEIDGKLKDINGNTVGYVSGIFEDDEQDFFDEVRHFTRWMERSDIAVFLADHCSIAVNDRDTDHELVEAIVEAIKSGDTSLDALEEFARNS